jgi:hypothetical protein
MEPLRTDSTLESQGEGPLKRAFFVGGRFSYSRSGVFVDIATTQACTAARILPLCGPRRRPHTVSTAIGPVAESSIQGGVSSMHTHNVTSLVLAIAFAFACSANAATAQDAGVNGKSGKPLTTQQLRMKNCNAEAKTQSLKGDERRAFMSTCLKGGSTELAARDTGKPAAPSPAQIKRKACSAEAKEKGLKGAERKTFVRECVSDDTVASAD